MTIQMTTPYQLLTRFAHLQLSPAAQAAIQQAVPVFTQWDAFVELAERQRMAPLVYHHLRQLDTAVPSPARLALQGLYLRHKQANETRFALLAEIVQWLEEAGISVWLLKGAALAPLVYPELALRPMGDLDLLVHPAQAEEAFALLCQHGFRQIAVGAKMPEEHRHLPVLAKEHNQLLVSVELHRWVGGTLVSGRPMSFEALTGEQLAVPLHGLTARTLSPVVMLRHLYNHMIGEPMRLIRLVDMMAVAETFVDVVDWELLRRQDTAVWAALSLFYAVHPLSPHLLEKARVPVVPPPAGYDQPLADWPPIPRGEWAGKSWRYILRQTFMPSPFTLRLYYGVANGRSLFWHRWFVHPFNIFRWWVQRRLGNGR